MSISLDIVPCCGSLDMYGEPDQSTAYSLSGHISITLSSSPSLFERTRAVQVLLESLVITFEGQSELVTEETGYSAFRLCSVSQELVFGEPIELTNDSMDSSGFSVWHVIFSLSVPGWLPASAPFGDTGGGILYGLYASAKIEHLDDGSQRSWLSTLCSPFRFPSKTIRTHVPIEVNRYISPSMTASSSTSAFPSVHFAVRAQEECSAEQNAFPREVLEKILVQVSIPERVGIEEESVPFTLRLRTDDLPESECAKLRAAAFSVDVEQIERYRTFPHTSYTAHYPVPPASEQPPRKKLCNPHPMQVLYHLGVAPKDQVDHAVSRTFSLLPDEVIGMYTVAGDGYIFKQDAQEDLLQRTWFSLSTFIPLRPPSGAEKAERDWRYDRSKRPSAESPFLNVTHRLCVTLTCTYDAGSERAPEQVVRHLRFHVPLRFVRLAPPASTRSPSPPLSLASDDVPSSEGCSAASLLDLPLPSVPYAQTLPAYSQLFHANGDRKIDYSMPLPRYTPRPSDTDLTVLSSTPPDTVELGASIIIGAAL